jgi:hypothetical protein
MRRRNLTDEFKVEEVQLVVAQGYSLGFWNDSESGLKWRQCSLPLQATIRSLKSDAALAALCATSPLQASSGKRSDIVSGVN